MPDFYVVPGAAVAEILADDVARIGAIVVAAYLAHQEGRAVNPASYFLRFPDKPGSRVIALPAYLGGEVDRFGIKWIASFPENVQSGLPRASAVLILNDYQTGRPVACLEAAGISAARTAASAVAVTTQVLRRPGVRHCVSFVGAGVIARTVLDHLASSRIPIAEMLCYDLDARNAGQLAAFGRERIAGAVTVGASLLEAMASDVVVFATTAATPYVPACTALRPGQLLLNLSLRDLAPELLLRANNIVDDVDHCLTAGTSPHLAEQLTGTRGFITGTIADLLRNAVQLDPRLPTVVSPFGLGALDVAVGSFVLDEAIRRDVAISIDRFIAETSRW